MKTDNALFTALMELPEGERFEIAMAVLDQISPSAMSGDEIVREAARLQEELECGVVRDLSYDEMIAGLRYRPCGPAK
jgi:hypothetical protein